MNKLAIMMKIGLDGEALNNEGTIGNIIQPKQVSLSDGTIRQALSGEMLKHYHSRNLRLLADGDELCETCKIFSPMKNGEIKKIDKNLSASGNRVKKCAVCDSEGFMNAGKGHNEKRKSCIEFSWGIATAENDYQTIQHSRIDPTEKNNKPKKKGENETTTSDANTNESQNTQMLFYKPLRSNIYAITIEIELDRIGFDDEKLVYAIDENARKSRQKKVIQALINMFIDMEGAMCSTRLPHIRNIEGVLVHKTDRNDILVKYSALNDDYKEVNKKIGTNVSEFNNIKEFIKVLNSVVDLQ
mgnify:CR=1 FL=1